jgi:hypothetical protein
MALPISVIIGLSLKQKISPMASVSRTQHADTAGARAGIARFWGDR